jgi:hypothetical protein
MFWNIMLALLPASSTMKLEVTYCSEMVLGLQRTTKHYILEDTIPQN